MAHGGSALAFDKGQTVFVPYTIPGEGVRVNIVREKGRVAFGEGVTLLDSSTDRVLPECPHFGPGRCWGCHWQHINYQAQVLLKQDVLADQLDRLGGFDDATVERALRPAIGAPDQWGYQYQATLERTSDGKWGFPRADNRGIEPIADCPLLHPDLQALYESLDFDFAGVKRMKLQLGTDGSPMLILMMKDEDAPELAADFPASVNIMLPDNEPVNLIGASHSIYHVGGRDFRVTAGSYFRSNVAMLEALVLEVLNLLDLSGDESVLDLYAGVGLFSAFIAPRAGLVTLVESYPPAATDADVNLADSENVDVIEGAVEEVLEAADETYHAAVIDPSGSGLSDDALTALLDLQIPRLVYVSSDPASLARDGKKLAQAGYHLQSIRVIDLAPQTYYVDSVALFVRM